MSKKSKKKQELADKSTQPTDDQQATQAKEAAPKELSLQEQLEEMTQRWQRTAADYQNYQKRAQQLQTQMSQFAQEDLAKAILPVLDNFQHTLEQGHDSQDIASLMQGVQIVHDHLRNALESFGMERIIVQQGDSFDPNKHEAILHQESEQVPENAIVQELAPGYTMNNRTLRPAKVSVAKSAAATEEQNE